MLHRFLVQNFDEIVSRTKALARQSPAASVPEREGAAPILARLLEELRTHPRTAPNIVAEAIGSTAARHARALLEQGWSVSQVVHDYGDVRQAITELAAAEGAEIAVEVIGALGRILDTAIAETVAEYTRLKDEATSHREVERLGQVGHDLRNHLQTAQLSFRAWKKGSAGIDGSAGDALGRSLTRLRDLVDTALSEAHLAATSRVSLAAFVHEMAAAAQPDAERRELRLAVEPGDPALAVDVDPQLLASALMNLLQNAFKFTRAHGCVTLRARGDGGRAFVEVEDECGGLETSERGPRRALGDRRGSDRCAPGRGLSSTRRAVQANGGELHAHDLPGRGCIFGIQLRAAAPCGAAG